MRPKTKTRAKARRYGKAAGGEGIEALAELPDEDHLREMVDAALSVARERQQLLEEIRDALARDEVDVERLILLVRGYCGLTRSLTVI